MLLDSRTVEQSVGLRTFREKSVLTVALSSVVGTNRNEGDIRENAEGETRSGLLGGLRRFAAEGIFCRWNSDFWPIPRTLIPVQTDMA